ncbi:MAG: putative CRISPR-associated protein [Desulfobacteraceae bacterium]
MVQWRDVLICTVGTSLKTNLERAEDPGIQKDIGRQNAKGLALQLLKQQPHDRLCGAEINSISSIVEHGYLNNPRKLVLLVSDTAEGKFIGQVLKLYYVNHNNPHCFTDVEVKTLEGLTDVEPQRFRTEGLRNLVRVIAQIVRQEGSEKIVVNATGGYKAQISFAGMIGQALEIPVCYLFERFSEVIELPPQPISLDMSFWLDNVDLFFALAADEIQENPARCDHRFGTLVDEIEVNNQKIISLSPVGQLLHETFRRRFKLQRQFHLPPDTGINPQDKPIKYEDQNAKRLRGLFQYIEKLRELPYVKRIYTHYFNPGLTVKNYFRQSATGKKSQIEGGYTDGKALIKFDLVTTATTESQRDSVLADLLESLDSKLFS